MSRPLPKRINQSWLDNQVRFLAVTAKTLNNGEPNPNYTKALQEIEQAEAEKRDWDTFANWVSANLDARVNQYKIKTSGGSIEAGTVFYSKKQNRFWKFESAWEKFCEANPEVNE